MVFQLDPRLEADSVFICDLSLSHVRLNRNAAFPWLLLIPRQNILVEIFDLSIPDQEQLLREIRQVAQIVDKQFKPKKLNIANLGNIVSQLHVHVIARQENDQAWPNPVWNSGVVATYTNEDLIKITATFAEALKV